MVAWRFPRNRTWLGIRIASSVYLRQFCDCGSQKGSRDSATASPSPFSGGEVRPAAHWYFGTFSTRPGEPLASGRGRCVKRALQPVSSPSVCFNVGDRSGEQLRAPTTRRCGRILKRRQISGSPKMAGASLLSSRTFNTRKYFFVRHWRIFAAARLRAQLGTSQPERTVALTKQQHWHTVRTTKPANAPIKTRRCLR